MRTASQYAERTAERSRAAEQRLLNAEQLAARASAGATAAPVSATEAYRSPLRATPKYTAAYETLRVRTPRPPFPASRAHRAPRTEARFPGARTAASQRPAARYL